jgi:hypothetical protein
MRFTATLSYKYASDEASQDHCEAYLAFCESNDTLPRATFTVYGLCQGHMWPLFSFYTYFFSEYVVLIQRKKNQIDLYLSKRMH